MVNSNWIKNIVRMTFCRLYLENHVAVRYLMVPILLFKAHYTNNYYLLRVGDHLKKRFRESEGPLSFL